MAAILVATIFKKTTTKKKKKKKKKKQKKKMKHFLIDNQFEESLDKVSLTSIQIEKGTCTCR